MRERHLRLVPTLPAHTCLAPGHTWAECLCGEIDPADVPCIVCECRAQLEAECPACGRRAREACDA